jgi:hypothetical protein
MQISREIANFKNNIKIKRFVDSISPGFTSYKCVFRLDRTSNSNRAEVDGE